jgi:hypothetical protein
MPGRKATATPVDVNKTTKYRRANPRGVDLPSRNQPNIDWEPEAGFGVRLPNNPCASFCTPAVK